MRTLSRTSFDSVVPTVCSPYYLFCFSGDGGPPLTRSCVIPQQSLWTIGATLLILMAAAREFEGSIWLLEFFTTLARNGVFRFNEDGGRAENASLHPEQAKSRME